MIEVKIEEKKYNNFTLKDIRFKIAKGEFVCLLGK